MAGCLLRPAFPSVRHASSWPSGTGTDIGASSTNAAWTPDSRPGASAETAVCGSVSAALTWRSGASNAARANVEDGPTEPISTATMRMPMHTDRTPCQPRSASR
jgi:hypothetical protein